MKQNKLKYSEDTIRYLNRLAKNMVPIREALIKCGPMFFEGIAEECPNLNVADIQNGLAALNTMGLVRLGAVSNKKYYSVVYSTEEPSFLDKNYEGELEDSVMDELMETVY